MTLPRFYEMQRYWEEHPPVGDLVAAYLGYKYQGSGIRDQGLEKTTNPSPLTPGFYGSLEELMAAFSTAGGKVQ
ncbi:MAG: hypothetical protein ABSA09_00550 [Desulfobaccales bacterium]|jgi:hypothetical protein